VRAALRDNYAKINIMQQELDLFGKKDEIELSRNTDLENEIKEEMIKKPNFNNIINDKLINLNIGEKKRKEFMEKYTETHILENIEYSFKYAEDRKTKIGAPLIIKAIEENWANSGPEKELLKEKERFLIELWSILYSYEGIKKEAEFCYQHTYIGTTIYLYNQISRATEEDFNNHRRFNEVRKQFKTLAEFQEAVKRHTKLELDAIENKLKNAKEKYNLSLDDLCKIKGYTKQDVFTKMEVSEDEFLRLKESLL
jgi:hypothetical protein